MHLPVGAVAVVIVVVVTVVVSVASDAMCIERKQGAYAHLLRASTWMCYCKHAMFLTVRAVVVPEPWHATTVILFFLVLVHDVLKWEHHPLLKNVMLLHPGVSSHDSLHFSMLATLLEDRFSITSPARVSHWTPARAAFHLTIAEHSVSLVDVPTAFVRSPGAQIVCGLHTCASCSATVFIGPFSRKLPAVHGTQVVSVTAVPVAFVHSPALHMV